MWSLSSWRKYMLARIVDAETRRVRRDLSELPNKLDHADSLIDAGVLGGAQPNAADHQIAAALRLLLAHEDLRPILSAWRSAHAALDLSPHFPGPPLVALAPIPVVLPSGWLPAPRGVSSGPTVAIP